MTSLGPVHFIAARFSADAVYEGRVIAEIERINASGALRVVDVLFVRKDPDTGELQTADEQVEGMGGLQTSRREIAEVGELLGPGEAAGMILIEHVWARDFGDALRATGGEPIAQGFLEGAVLAELEQELAAAGG